LKVKVNFGGLRAVYVWKNIFALVEYRDWEKACRLDWKLHDEISTDAVDAQSLRACVLKTAT